MFRLADFSFGVFCSGRLQTELRFNFLLIFGQQRENAFMCHMKRCHGKGHLGNTLLHKNFKLDKKYWPENKGHYCV